MNRRSWDSASSHWLASLQCASPPARRTEKPSGSCCKREASPHCGSPFLCSPLNRTGLDHNTHPLSAAPSGGHGLCEAVKRRRPGWGVEGVGVGCRFLCYCLVLKGRSQLSILRLRGEKAPCREVRYPLRNRNYCAFYPLPGHTFRCAFRPFFYWCFSLVAVWGTWRWR